MKKILAFILFFPVLSFAQTDGSKCTNKYEISQNKRYLNLLLTADGREYAYTHLSVNVDPSFDNETYVCRVQGYRNAILRLDGYLPPLNVESLKDTIEITKCNSKLHLDMSLKILKAKYRLSDNERLKTQVKKEGACMYEALQFHLAESQ